MGLMMKEGLLKENIDGEALQWAAQRLRTRSEKRKILIPVADGAPVDDSTLSVNPASFLEKHVHDVVAEIEGSGIELHAVGINHDTSRWYKNNYTLSGSDNPYTAAAEIIESVARYAPGQEHRVAVRLRRQKIAAEQAGNDTGMGASRVRYGRSGP